MFAFVQHAGYLGEHLRGLIDEIVEFS